MTPPDVDVGGPRLLAHSLEGLHAVEVPVGTTIELMFDAALDPATVHVGSVAVKAWETVGRCDTTPLCERGKCARGRCQVDPWSAAELRAVDEGRFVGTEMVDVELADDAVAKNARLRLRPRVPLLAEQRYSMVLGSSVRAPSGAPVLGVDGTVEHVRIDFTTAKAGSSGPEPTLVQPRHAELDVPRNLSRIQLEFPQPVVLAEDTAWWVEDEHGGTTRLVDPVPCRAWVPGYCLEFRLEARLRANVWHRLATGFARDLLGRDAVWPRNGGMFHTSLHADEHPPATDSIAVGEHAGCTVVSLLADEPTIVRVTMGDQSVERVGRGALVLGLRASEMTTDLVVELADLADNRVARTFARGPQEGPALVISEVLANPRGSEPDQEFVELRALEALVLEGAYLSDLPWLDVQALLADGKRSGDALPTLMLEREQLVVLVGDDYVVGAADDPSPPASAHVVRLASSLANGGLKNAGESLSIYLADPPRLLASYGDFIPTSSKAHEGRSVTLVDPQGCDLPTSWQSHPWGTSSPGRLP